MSAGVTVRLGGHEVFSGGVFRLSRESEAALTAHLRSTELYTSAPSADGFFRPPVDFPPHERAVEIDIDLGAGQARAEVLGADLSHEYISENADYRS